MLRKPEAEEAQVKKALELTQQLAQQFVPQQVRGPARALQLFLRHRMLMLHAQNPPQVSGLETDL